MGLFDIFKKEQLTEEEKAQKQAEKQKQHEERVKQAQENYKRMQANRNVMLEVVGGMPGLSKFTRIFKGKNPGEIRLDKMNVNLITYQWGEQGSRSVGKAAAGAIIGGVLTGGVGTIVGAAIGAKKKDKSLLTLVVEKDGRTYTVAFRCDDKQYGKFSEYCLS